MGERKIWRVVAVPAAALIAAAGAAAIAQVRLRPGQYESVTEIQMPGIPGGPMKDTSCVTAEDIANLPNLMTEAAGGADCKITNMKSSPTALSFTSVCDSGGEQYTAMADMTFGTDSFAGVMNTKMSDGTGFVVKMTARRIGDCQ